MVGFKKALLVLYFLFFFLHVLTVSSRTLREEASHEPSLQAPVAIDGDGFAGKGSEITAVVRKGGGGRGGGRGSLGGRGGGSSRVIPVRHGRGGHSSSGWSLKPGSGSVGFMALLGLVFMF